MIKPILTFSLAVLLCACATNAPKQIPQEVRAVKRVDFFASGHTQAAFKITGTLNGDMLQGVLIAKKIDDDSFEVSVMTGGAYRVLQATVTDQGIAYRYLFKDADTSLVRGRIAQFLNLLLLEPGTYKRRRVQPKQFTVAYKGPSATVHLIYQPNAVYPYAAKTITMLNTAELFYESYAPADAQGTLLVPHEMIYKDGKLELNLQLISLK